MVMGRIQINIRDGTQKFYLYNSLIKRYTYVQRLDLRQLTLLTVLIESVVKCFSKKERTKRELKMSKTQGGVLTFSNSSSIKLLIICLGKKNRYAIFCTSRSRYSHLPFPQCMNNVTFPCLLNINSTSFCSLWCLRLLDVKNSILLDHI